MAEIDLNRFPEVPNQIPLLRWNIFEDFPNLVGHGGISERIYGCARFIGIKKDDKNLILSEKADLRAAINEFVSLSELISHKYPHLTIEKSNIPLFHFIKELRVVNFHLTTFVSGKSNVKTQFINTETGVIDTNNTFDHDCFIIENCTVDLFSKNKNFRSHYFTVEFKKTVEWVAENQKSWGVNKIIELSLRQYCNLISLEITQPSSHFERSREMGAG